MATVVQEIPCLLGYDGILFSLYLGQYVTIKNKSEKGTTLNQQELDKISNIKKAISDNLNDIERNENFRLGPSGHLSFKKIQLSFSEVLSEVPVTYRKIANEQKHLKLESRLGLVIESYSPVPIVIPSIKLSFTSFEIDNNVTCIPTRDTLPELLVTLGTPSLGSVELRKIIDSNKKIIIAGDPNHETGLSLLSFGITQEYCR